MSRPVIVADNIRLAYPLYSFEARSLRRVAFSKAVGGQVKKESGTEAVFVQALEGVSFQLQEGDRLGIAGHNGSGKSTLLRVLAGIYEPDNGSVKIDGTVSSYLDLSLGLDAESSGRDNISTLLRLRGLSKDKIAPLIDEIAEFSGLGSFIDMPVRAYSAGMLSRLVFSTATSIPVDVLLMDEWLSAGDAEFGHQAAERMSSVFNGARVAVLASHNGHLIHQTCNKLLVLKCGRPIYFGTTKDAPGSFE